MTLLFALLFSLNAHTAEISETFSSRDTLSSSTAVWNQALGKIHPTLRVMSFKAGFSPLDVDISDGSHGVFDITTYANFSIGGNIAGNIIRLDTSLYPILKVTSFHLASGWRLEPIGNNPLVIHSLSDVSIEGEIWCQGEDGFDATGATPNVGGTGRCGGANGGDGGAPNTDALDGTDISGMVTGGEGGRFTGATATGGGGGGSFNLTSVAGNGPNSSGPNGGLAGQSVSDPEFLTLAGGAGGGGGSGTTVAGGAGGGGGGGLVIIHAVRDFNLGTSPTSTNGFIFVNGGDGGTSNVTGGPGGGGGGGGVQVFVGGTINIYNTDGAGASQADGGGGVTVGASGRSWFSSVNYNGVGFYTPAEELPVVPGNVEFNSAAQSVTTIAMDLARTFVTINSLALTPASADFTFEAAGSADAFAGDDTGFTTDLAALSNKRYLKFRITIATSDVNNPMMVDTATITYTAGSQTEFAFKAAGCGRVDGSPGAILPMLFVLLTLVFLKFKSEQQAPVRR